MAKMKRLVILTLFCLYILPSFLAANNQPSPDGREAGFASFPPLLPIPVQASEEETIDSMNVHPLNRYNIKNVGWSTAAVNFGILNLTDVGDGSTDRYELEVTLKSLDDSITMEYMLDSNDSSAAVNFDGGGILLTDASDGASYFWIKTQKLVDSGGSRTIIQATDETGSVQTYQLAAADALRDEEWYIVEFDFDLPRSKLEVEITFRNSTRILKDDWFDLFPSIDFLSIFSATNLNMSFYADVRTNGKKISAYLNYIDAPFKEREWEHYDVATDAQWLQSSVTGHVMEDDTDDTDGYQLVKPLLDTISGSITIDAISNGYFAAGDHLKYNLSVYAVDAADGDLHHAAGVSLFLLPAIGAGTCNGFAYIGVNGVWDSFDTSVPSTGTDRGDLEFSIRLMNDRSRIEVAARAWWDGTDDGTIDVASIDLSNVTSDYSNEFVIRIDAYASFTGNSMNPRYYVNDLGFIERDIFTNIITGIQDFISWLIISVFILIGRFLAAIFKIVGDFIVLALSVGFALLDAGLTALATLLGTLATWLSDIWDELVALAAAIGDYLLTLVADFVDGVITFLLSVASDLIDLFAQILFFFWDALGLPNLLVWLSGFIAGASNTLAAFGDVITFIITVSTIAGPLTFAIQWGLPLAMGANIEGYTDAWTRIAGFDLSFGLLEGYIPKIPFLAVAILLWIPFLGAYAGFF